MTWKKKFATARSMLLPGRPRAIMPASFLSHLAPLK
uniref:Uncharacterized protein n=1 Tax=Arundo donax TaxID=35708 RepID=A0A0A9AMQ4_ARUDO